MKVIGILAALALALAALYFLVVYIIIPIVLPILGFILLALGGIAALYGLYKSIQSFGTAFIANINPYDTYVDTYKKRHEGINRAYFFGPGVHQMRRTVVAAFRNLRDKKSDVDDFKEQYILDFVNVWHERVRNILVWFLYIVALICLYLFGFGWVLLFSGLLTVIVLVGMLLFFIFFSLLWLVDRCFLWMKSIQSRCGRCKNYFVIPNFRCGCGYEHTRLTPGAYGVIWRKCPCGTKMPTTVFNGRSRLDARCPKCDEELAAGGAKQIGIQVVGGVNAGKTTFLTAFWHEYFAMQDASGAVKYKKHEPETFDELEGWFEQGISVATTELNATMYSVVHELSMMTSVQLTLYDIAGESFGDIGYEIQQQQFRYCEGFVFIIDPTRDATVADEIITNFINTYKEISGKHANDVTKIPVAVTISKADLFADEIGLPKIKELFDENPEKYAEPESKKAPDIANARNEICREFLKERDHNNLINLLDATFTNVQYFPVSAIGHEEEYGTAYEPWGVLAPVEWILEKADDNFKKAVIKQAAEQ